MSEDWTCIELAARLRTMNRVLDRMIADPLNEAVAEVLEITLEKIAQHKMAEAITVLEEMLRASPSWFRGYLLLATIYQDVQNTAQAITTIETGLAMCIRGLRLFHARGWVATVKRITGPVVRSRMANNAERLRRYEGLFRHRLATLRVQCGHYDEALVHWSSTEDEQFAC